MSLRTIGPEKFVITHNGEDLSASKSFAVVNPATGQVFAEAPEIDLAQLDAFMTSADRAYRHWRIDESARVDALLAAANVIEENVDYLAGIVTSEQGMPFHESQGEVGRAVEWLRYYANLEIPREVVQDDETGYQEVFRRPLGVVVGITPWNFPVSLAFWKAAPALRAGNTVVLKPSAYTPLALLEVARLLRGVFPDGVFSVVTAQGELGSRLVTHPLTRKVSFTGSTEVGRKVGVAAAQELKRFTLELGGNDPAVIFDDVDMTAIGERLFWGSFLNNGQMCMAAKRVYVQESIYQDVVEAVAAVAGAMPVGDGMVAGNYLGPLTNRPQWDRVAELVDAAVSDGAQVVTGGSRLDRDGYFYQPTVLTNLADHARVVDEEQFGPVMPIIPFSTEEEGIARANASEFGLTASVWTGDYDRALRVGAEIDAGQVSINGHGWGVRPWLPFGGHKDSGIGTENGLWGYYGFTETQAMAGPPRPKA